MDLDIILRSCRKPYVIKGGRACMAYFVGYQSSDWDIMGTEEFLEEFISKLPSSILIESMPKFNSYHFRYRNDQEPFADVIIYSSLPAVFKINGLNYINLHDYVDDLMKTISSRKIILENLLITLDFNTENYHRILDSIGIKYEIEYGMESSEIINDITSLVNDILIQNGSYQMDGQTYLDNPIEIMSTKLSREDFHEWYLGNRNILDGYGLVISGIKSIADQYDQYEIRRAKLRKSVFIYDMIQTPDRVKLTSSFVEFIRKIHRGQYPEIYLYRINDYEYYLNDRTKTVHKIQSA